MGLCTTRKIAVLMIAVWLAIMVYLWAPEYIPGFQTKASKLDKGVYRMEADAVKKNFSQENAVHVCVTSDKNTLGGMFALVNSVHSNTKHPVVFHLVVDQESLDHAKVWMETTKLHDVHYELVAFPEEWVKDKIKIRGGRKELGSPLNYARYYLPKLFPNLKGRVIFIDDDSIVQGDIMELYNMKLKPGDFAAFSNDCTGTSKRLTLMKNNYINYIDFKNKHILDLDLNPNDCSFNTGVFVTDFDLWRKNNLTEKLEYWITLNTKEEVYGNEKGGGGSQPPMMIVFYKKYTNLDPSWNVRYLGWTSGTSYTKQFLKHAKLLHWNGRFKPWGRVSQHSSIWDKYFVPDPLGKFKPIRRQKS